MLNYTESVTTVCATVVMSLFVVSLGIASEPKMFDRTLEVVMDTLHANSAAETAFFMQTTGFCEPSTLRAINVDLATGETVEQIC